MKNEKKEKTVFDLIEDRTADRISAWKNRSLVFTFEGLKKAGAVITRGRIFDRVFDVYHLAEGVTDLQMMEDVTDIIFNHIKRMK